MVSSSEAMNRPDGSGREFAFSAQDFERVRKLIYAHAGISLSDSKQEMVYSRLARRLRATGLKSFSDYLSLLESNDAGEWEAFTNSLTTNLTSFFREEHHFPILAQHLASLKGKRNPLRIWCCAASTGEEPYSIAMTAVEALGSMSPPVEIIATDVDTTVLAKGAAGVYAMDRLEKMTPERLRRFFLKGKGKNSGLARVRDELRDMITFQQINLLHDSWPLQGSFDVIFCRNVMIYFDKATQHSILKKFVPLMQPDGLLFAGHSESFLHAAEYFKLRGKTVYQLARAGAK